jgi:hypothetical protein
MRHTIVVASSLLAVALVAAAWSHSIVGHRPDTVKAGASSIGIMQLMKDSKGLPEQNYPAY